MGVRFVGVYIAKVTSLLYAIIQPTFCLISLHYQCFCKLFQYPEDSPWSETDTKDNYQGEWYVEADDTLTAFTRWLHDNKERLPRRDQASVFTG